jgi:hypothetical protein
VIRARRRKRALSGMAEEPEDYSEHEVRARRLAHFLVKLAEGDHMTGGHAAADDTTVRGVAREGWKECPRDPCRRIAGMLRDVGVGEYFEDQPASGR